MTPPPTDRRTLLGVGAGVAGLGALAGCQGVTRAALGGDDHEAALDELFADLEDQRHTGEAITAEERVPRRKRAAELLGASGADALVVEPGATLDYLTGVSWGTSERLFALVLLADGTELWICPSFEAERAKGKLAAAGCGDGEIIPWDEHEYAFAPLAAALDARKVERVRIEPRCRFFVGDRLARAFGDPSRVLGADELVQSLRGRKDARELGLMRRANEITKQALVAVSERIEPGMTGGDIGAMVKHAQERLGLRRTWALALLGPDAAEPHGKDGTLELTPGEVVLIDTGGSFHGYQSDITRTWVHGAAPSDEVSRVWNTVRDAQRRAFETLRPGLRCRDIDAAARAVIEAGGFGSGYETFTHRLGHGIGLQGHEEPYLDGGNELVLAPGMTFSNEPGIYLRGDFGVRIEDIVAVTDDGADVFGGWQQSPRSPR